MFGKLCIQYIAFKQQGGYQCSLLALHLHCTSVPDVLILKTEAYCLYMSLTQISSILEKKPHCPRVWLQWAAMSFCIALCAFQTTVSYRLWEHLRNNRYPHKGSRHYSSLCVYHPRKHGLCHDVAVCVFTVDQAKPINNAVHMEQL